MALNDKKRYWYVQVSQVFFDDPVITKLKRMPGGKEALLAYLEILVLAGKTNGILTWDMRRHQSLAEQISLSLRETTPEEVEAALIYFMNNDYIRELEGQQHQFELVQADEMTKSLTGAALRKQKQRSNLSQGTERGTMSPITKKLITNNNNNNNKTTTTVVAAAINPEKPVDNSALAAKIRKLEANGIRTNVELFASQYTECELDAYIYYAKSETKKENHADLLFYALNKQIDIDPKYFAQQECPQCRGTKYEYYDVEGITEPVKGVCSCCKGKGYVNVQQGGNPNEK